VKDNTTLVIADDHPIFRKGLKEAIESHEGFSVVAEAENGEIALKRIREFKPKITILDIEMPLMDGFGVAKSIREDHLPVDIIFLTMYNDEDMFNAAMDIGAKGYLLKENAAQDVLECIQIVASGKYFLSPLISLHLINRNDRAKSLLQKHPSLIFVTPTEKKVLRLIAESKTSKEIASELFISYKTVENHRTNIAKKLSLHGNHQLLKFAIENKSFL
jgi:DNA-binding NarL/FixJ family response regulator